MEYDLPWDYKACLDSNPNFKAADIAELRAWAEGEESSVVIPKDISDKMLLCFHNACGFLIEDTKKCIKTYYSTRDKAPEFFDDRDFAAPLMLECSQRLEFAVLPEKTPDECAIIYHGLFDHAPDKYHFNEAVRCLLMTTDKCVYELGPVKGVIFLFDMRGVKLGHLTRVNLGSLGKFFTYIQDGMPLSIKKIYIMNSVPFFDKVMMLIKPFMKKELISLLSLFPPNTDYEAFHKDFLPKRILPPHYGGDLPDISILSKNNFEKLISMKPYFDAEEKHRYAFSKKSKKRAKVETNFRHLSID